jgi:low temperature requirement protein LtrA
VASTAEGTRERLDPGSDQEQRVSPLELFFDLVFVLSFTQVTLSMAEIPTRELRGQA